MPRQLPRRLSRQLPRQLSRRLGGMLLGAVLVIASLGTTQAAGAKTTARVAPTSKVDVVLTDPARKVYLTPQASLAWHQGRAPSGATITVDESRRYQSVEGFGASFTDSSAWLVGTRLDRGRREAALRALFDRRGGIGLSFLRQPMGASDFAVDGNYSYDDMPPGQTDPTLAHFSIDHDRAYVIPVLREARRLNPALTLMASPWSPPGWMKTSDSMVGGTLRPDAYQPLADYFAKFLHAYAAEGLPIRYISPNNEPLYVPAGYPGMDLGPDKAATLIRDHLGPTLAAEGLSSTGILGYDHNWDVLSYPESLYADPDTARFVTGTAWHCYGGDVRAQSLAHNDYPGKPAFHTECSGGEWEGDDQAGFVGAMSLIVNSTREWAKSVVRWNIALDAGNGPTNGGCLTCRGVLKVTQDADGRWNYAKTVDYYALGHASKYVVPGARRIASSALADGSVDNVAFVNPDGSKALLALNPGTSAKSFRVQWGDRWFTTTLPAGAAATFTWDGRQRGPVDSTAIGSVDLHLRGPGQSRPVVSYDSDLLGYLDQVRVGDTWVGYSLPTGATLTSPVAATPLPRSDWTASAVASSPDDPPARAIDDDPATRWSSGRGMAPGDWFQVDLGTARSFEEIRLDTTGSPGDFARGYEVYVSDDGRSWGRPIARGGGRTQLRVVFPTVTARYVRIVDTGASGSWWSIHDLSILGTGDPARGAPGEPAVAAREPFATPTVTQPLEPGLQRQRATMPDGTKLEVVYNPGPDAATFEVGWAGSTYRYRLPAGAVAAFTSA